MKKCPVCNSTRFVGNYKEKHCNNCGYTWKSSRYHKSVITKKYRIGNEKHQKTTRNNEKFSSLQKIDIHDNVYKFKILKDNPNVSIGRKIQMKNWNMEILEREDVVYRRTPKNIIISLNKRQMKKIRSIEDIDKIEQNLKDTVKCLAEAFSKEFAIELELTPFAIAKEVKLVEAFQSPVQFIGENVKCVYPNGDVEFIGKDAIDSVKNFYENMALESRADALIKKMDGGFDTLSYLMTQQNEILSKQTEMLSKFNTSSSSEDNPIPIESLAFNFISRVIRGIKSLFGSRG